MPHADDAPGGAARSPNKHDEPSVKQTNRYESRFAVIKAVVGPSEVTFCEDFPSPAHIQTTLGQRTQALRRIAGDAHI
jgi:hypothetical protein